MLNTPIPPTCAATEPFVTLKVAAYQLGVPVSGLRRVIKSGLLPSYDFGCRRRVRFSELLVAIERLSASPTSQVHLRES
jgi:excisionase family DNA binding protein